MIHTSLKLTGSTKCRVTNYPPTLTFADGMMMNTSSDILQPYSGDSGTALFCQCCVFSWAFNNKKKNTLAQNTYVLDKQIYLSHIELSGTSVLIINDPSVLSPDLTIFLSGCAKLSLPSQYVGNNVTIRQTCLSVLEANNCRITNATITGSHGASVHNINVQNPSIHTSGMYKIVN